MCAAFQFVLLSRPSIYHMPPCFTLAEWEFKAPHRNDQHCCHLRPKVIVRTPREHRGQAWPRNASGYLPVLPTINLGASHHWGINCMLWATCRNAERTGNISTHETGYSTVNRSRTNRSSFRCEVENRRTQIWEGPVKCPFGSTKSTAPHSSFPLSTPFMHQRTKRIQEKVTLFGPTWQDSWVLNNERNTLLIGPLQTSSPSAVACTSGFHGRSQFMQLPHNGALLLGCPVHGYSTKTSVHGTTKCVEWCQEKVYPRCSASPSTVPINAHWPQLSVIGAL